MPLSELASSFMTFYKAGNLTALADIMESIRYVVSQDDIPPINELLQTGIVPYIINLLKPELYNEERLITETSWVATNIASRESEHVDYLVGLELIPRAMQLLDHPNQDVKENAIWILSNISGESLVYRDDMLKRKIVPKIENLFNTNAIVPALYSSICWLMSNLCRGKPYPNFYDVKCYY